MADQMESRLHALEQLQSADEPLAPFDLGTLAAIKRAAPTLVARCDAVARIEAGRTKKRAARRKAAPARRGPSVFDPAADHSERLLP